MDINFALLLFYLTFFSGLIALFDILNKRFFKKFDAQYIKNKVAKFSILILVVDVWSKLWHLVVDLSRSLFLIFLIVFSIRSFIVEPFQIPSGSMRPTLKVGDFILVNKLSYGIRIPVVRKRIITWSDIKRGDIIVFNFPGDMKINFIKRTIGLPGDKVQYDGINLYINDKKIITSMQIDKDEIFNADLLVRFNEKLTEHSHFIYRNRIDSVKTAMKTFSVPKDHYFVMGDNRDNSHDGRYWGFVHKDLVQGKAFVVWLHWAKFLSKPDFSQARIIHE